jgi:[acyl-carrier-protein] S-malonyltransferase
MSVKDKKFVFLFPGQGAQYPGMALDFWEASAAVKDLFRLASGIMGKDMKVLLGESGEEILKRTDISQPVITLANLAAAAYLREREILPQGCAGFSLGEYAALTGAGVISPEDCFRLVKIRGEAMQAASDKLRENPGGSGQGLLGAPPGMAAVIGLVPDQVEELISKWAAEGLSGLYAANINSVKQVAVSGTAAALDEAEKRFKEAGARRVLRLQVAGPFHSPLMAEAAESFSRALEAVAFKDPETALYSNVSGKLVESGVEAKILALRQITEPVRWVDEEGAVAATEGLEAVLETGPGKVLQGLWKDTGSALPCYAAGRVEDIENLPIFHEQAVSN